MIRALILCAACLASLPWLILAAPAWPHDWYPPSCCSGRDCAPIPASAVQITPEGYLVTLEPGDHPFVAKHSVTLWRFEDADPTNDYPIGQGTREARRSEDSEYHACLASSGRGICFFAPDTGA